MAATVSILVVDDSALMRNLIGKIITKDSELHLAGTAINGVDALEKVEKLHPNAITLDLEMPEMNGIEFLKELNKRGIDTPVIVVSSVATRAAAVTMRALSLGAKDFVTKPSGAVSHDIADVADRLLHLVKLYAWNYISHKRRVLLDEKSDKDRPVLDKGVAKSPFVFSERQDPSSLFFADEWPKYVPAHKPVRADVLCIGISTGGPSALSVFLAAIPHDFPLPILLVQHMPAGFTAEFAKTLNRICPLEVKEAETGDAVARGRVLLAPGDKHLTIEESGGYYYAKLSHKAPCNGHRPSVDILFKSAVENYGDHTMALIMTGMGRDGAMQMGELYKRGAMTMAEAKDSCIVYGMPRMAIEAGYTHYSAPLADLAGLVVAQARRLAVPDLPRPEEIPPKSDTISTANL